LLLGISKTFGLNSLKKRKYENRTIHQLGLFRINDCDATLPSMDLHRICLHNYSRIKKMERETIIALSRLCEGKGLEALNFKLSTND